MEPMRIPEGSAATVELNELAFELAQRSASFRSSLPKGLAEPLADYVRSMNCYYSNLIEGHDTHPVDIERALNNDLAADDPKKRNLQLEAKAHIEVQRWIDEGRLQNNELSAAGIREIHRRFISLLPDELRWAKHRDRDERIEIVPGQYRENDAQVGNHIAVSPGAIPRFMTRFENCYAKLKTFDAVISAGAAHHRLLFVHPFADGNGRVTRLVSYATLRRTLDTGGLWSIARGLSRRVKDYKNHLAACDDTRHGDRDGRGNLSEVELVNFSKFF